MVKVIDEGFSDPLSNLGLFSKASAIALKGAVKNLEDESLKAFSLIFFIIIEALLGMSHIFMPAPQF